MDELAALIMAGIALESLFQVLRTIWEPAVRQEWNFTRTLMLLLVLGIAIPFAEWNLVAGSGLDLGNDVIGRILSALALLRITQWLHEVYKKTTR